MMSRIHFGDLHAPPDGGYESLSRIESVICPLASTSPFLQGEHADSGTREQYRHILAGLDGRHG